MRIIDSNDYNDFREERVFYIIASLTFAVVALVYSIKSFDPTMFISATLDIISGMTLIIAYCRNNLIDFPLSISKIFKSALFKFALVYIGLKVDFGSLNFSQSYQESSYLTGIFTYLSTILGFMAYCFETNEMLINKKYVQSSEDGDKIDNLDVEIEFFFL